MPHEALDHRAGDRGAGKEGHVSTHRPPREVVGASVVLRAPTVDDAALPDAAIQDSVEELRIWMPWAAAEPQDLADRVILIRDWDRSWRAGEDFIFGVFHDATLIGGCGLHRRVADSGLEIGYWIRTGYTGRGQATAAAAALVSAAFAMPAIDHVEIHHDRANRASSRVPEKLGFTFVEERRDGRATAAEHGVERIWRMTLDQWVSAPRASSPRA